MAFLTAHTDTGRRRALLIGTGTYRPGWPDIRRGVEEELRSVRRLFADDLAYEDPAQIRDPTRITLTDGVADWFAGIEWEPQDAAVVYYTGHAVIAGNALQLVTSDIALGEEHKALDAVDLARWIWGGTGGSCRHVLLILDTCHSGAAATQLLGAARSIQESIGGNERAGELYVITTARSVEDAGPGWFAERLESVTRKGKGAGPSEEWLRPDSLLSAINTVDAAMPLAARQHADITGRGEGEFRFFPNPRWDPHLHPSMDPAQRRRALQRIQSRALTTHWEPHARGVSIDTEPGWYFTGRGTLLRAMTSWLASSEADDCRLILGRPGSGKSAVLSWLAYMSDPRRRMRAAAEGGLEDIDNDLLPPEEAIDLAVHARAKSATELVLEIATGLDLKLAVDGDADTMLRDVVNALEAIGRVVVVVDAIDEADNPYQAAANLRYLAEEAPQLRVLAGARGGDPSPGQLVSRLGGRFSAMDLDSPQYGSSQEIAMYVTRYLLRRQGSPYRGADHTSLVSEIAHEVAKRARGSFLIASATSHMLATSDGVIRRREISDLPATLGQTFDAEIARFPTAERMSAMAVLSAFAFAEGRGLPRALCAPLATALAGRPLTDADVDHWLGSAEFYVVTDDAAGEARYRLHHEEFASYIRNRVVDRLGYSVTQRIIADVLSRSAGTPPDWFTAHPYIRRHLPIHAVEGGELESYADDPSFLVAVDPTALLEAARRARRSGMHGTEWVRRLLRLAYHRIHDEAKPAERASHLQFAARQLGDHGMADDIAATIELPWVTTWAAMTPDSRQH